MVTLSPNHVQNQQFVAEYEEDEYVLRDEMTLHEWIKMRRIDEGFDLLEPDSVRAAREEQQRLLLEFSKNFPAD